ncbi:L-threonylcarbamoyladenylate synthase [Algoriphagus sediminis]|uniref:Threonylcarbamoyl-AMP synthase n=1 Tax=Algoriphagus sediminis TaxID=3057113 RepID=A0ABT7Y971_9BACT|nr:L-threonylcarbamoyladenylate synthase [Algoriphagus sediminis]MDN3203063.1 L-threonylcarbamoyladenylate synthase [Algoriphagus sediminis]
MALISRDIFQAAKALNEGEVIGIPTETVYGLAGNALDGNVVAKIFEVKERPSFDPLIVHVSGVDQVSEYCEKIPEPLAKLADNFWPGPLTLLLPRKKIIPDIVTSGLPRVAVRVPSHPLTLELLKNLDFPLAAPSANPFGYISPTTAAHVNAQLGEKIPFVLDGGNSQIGLESTIAGMEGDEAVIYRLGGLSIDSIENLIGKVKVTSHSSSNPQAPGLLKSHYAPKVPFRLGDIEVLLKESEVENERIGILSLSKEFDQITPLNQVQLSPSGNLNEAAQNLFAAMRKLDDLDIDLILAEPMPESGLGKAINDRLRRAAVKD